MKLRATFSALVLAGLCATGSGLAADTKTQPAPTPQEKAWADWMQKNVPGEPHKMLQACEGEWNLQLKMWMGPDSQPTTSTGKSSIKMILDGRYLEETATGDMAGFPFKGTGLTAYDNSSKQYQGTWADNMSTAIFQCAGSYDPATKSITMEGMTFDPASGKDVKVKCVRRMVSDNSFTFEWWGPAPSGKMFKSMEITYNRQ